MLNSFIFVVMPYAALALLIFVTPYRFCSNRLTWSAYSTQFLERNALFWGINPWHYGIIAGTGGPFSGRCRPRPDESVSRQPEQPDHLREHRPCAWSLRRFRLPGTAAAPRQYPAFEAGHIRLRLGTALSAGCPGPERCLHCNLHALGFPVVSAYGGSLSLVAGDLQPAD